MVNDVSPRPIARLPLARYAMRPVLASFHAMATASDPVLLQGREGRWRWPWAVSGLVLIAAMFMALGSLVVMFEELAVRAGWIGSFPDNVFPLDSTQPITYLDVLLAAFPFLLPPLIALPLVHGVSWRRAFAYSGARFRWREFWRTALALLTLAVLGFVIGNLTEPKQYEFRAPPALAWIALALAIVFVQSIGEEVLFRGYLLRTWGAVLPFRLPVTTAIIGLFVAGHLGNDDLNRDLLVNIFYFIAGEIVAYAVFFRTNNLAASSGFHWMNNVLALLVPTIPGQPTTLALAVYTDPVYAVGASRLFDPWTHIAGLAGITALVAMLYWRRSPFYLEKAQSHTAGPEAIAADAGGETAVRAQPGS